MTHSVLEVTNGPAKDDLLRAVANTDNRLTTLFDTPAGLLDLVRAARSPLHRILQLCQPHRPACAQASDLAVHHPEDDAAALNARRRDFDRHLTVGDIAAVVASPGERQHALCSIDLVRLLIRKNATEQFTLFFLAHIASSTNQRPRDSVMSPRGY
jgi:hypothetical protein